MIVYIRLLLLVAFVVIIYKNILTTYAVISASGAKFVLRLKSGQRTSDLIGQFKVRTLQECGLHCHSKSNCVGFNFGGKNQESLVCELVSKRFQGNDWEYNADVEDFNYYEEHCNFPEDYCNGRGALSAADATLKCAKVVELNNCSCQSFYTGSHCEKGCKFVPCPGCDLYGPGNNVFSIDIYNATSQKSQPCIVNCSLLKECESVYFKQTIGYCYYKKESMFKRNISLFSKNEEINVLYSKNCT